MTDQLDFILTKRGETLHLRFLSKRAGTIVTLLALTAIVISPITIMTISGVNRTVLNLVWGGSFSCILTIWYVIVPMIARVNVTIEPDIVRFQWTWFGVPLGTPDIYARNTLTDLSRQFNAHGSLASTCNLSVWQNGRSITLERAFPANGLRRLRWELAEYGVDFPVTSAREEFEMQSGGRIK